MARGVSEKLLATLPEKYRPGFVDEIDRRTVLGRAVSERLAALETDQGGAEAMSHARKSLVRRAVWLEILVESHEVKFADGEGLDVGAYTQALNTLLGVYRALGVERRRKPVKGLRAALEPAT